MRKIADLDFIIAVYFLVLWTVGGCKFLGGTVSWMAVPPGNRVRLTYRLSWQRGSGPCGPACGQSDVGRKGSVSSLELSALKWVSITGNITKTINDVNYVMTSISVRNVTGWEQGEDVIFIVGPFTQPFIVALSSIPWIYSRHHTNRSSLGYMETYIDTRKRNDTGKPNNSPYTSFPSYIGIPFACTSHVKFPVEDPEVDNVRCRLATASECAGACTNVPENSVWVDKVNCTLTIKAYKSTGYKKDSVYRLTLVAEDFPESTITMGTEVFTRRDSLSRIPIQVTLRVLDGSCNEKKHHLTFVRPTLPNLSRSSFGIPEIIRHLPVAAGFYLEARDAQNINETEVIMSGPMYLNHSYFPDDQSIVLNRTNVVRVGVKWRPHFPNQIGNQQFCVWGVDMHGITTGPRCVTSIVGDDGDHCASGTVTCDNNGTCINVFKVSEEKCVCAPGYKSTNCSQALRCYDNPCENNGTCIDRTNRVLCQCQKDYAGVLCEYKVDMCVQSPCLNGGTCLDVNNTYKCLCTSSYTGQVCEHQKQLKSESKGSEDAFLWLLLPIIIGIVATVTLVTSSFLVITGVSKKPPRKPSKVKPNDNNNRIMSIEDW
ncbi:uncharacterized protein LOC123565925 [Mercenaria mercenaria]|uniref:uncharacterized protein LOC123565925 n=1 Tax=Mercenaria mercenaria TaxID=6596 RepID=UPI00234F6A3E|nr:uncharacterized protein LOC123565925 [Mercenaria mercenaria]